jgi:hypothetical protein
MFKIGNRILVNSKNGTRFTEDTSHLDVHDDVDFTAFHHSSIIQVLELPDHRVAVSTANSTVFVYTPPLYNEIVGYRFPMPVIDMRLLPDGNILAIWLTPSMRFHDYHSLGVISTGNNIAPPHVVLDMPL